ncbi:MAG TPA: hypothetical protein VM283_02610, partial [Armatimonadota bacterium]|nr:hypothetical protein [Armatimonadota bacterium]
MRQGRPAVDMDEQERAWLARLGEIAHAAGARAWLVGGPVRDLLLGAARPDTDLAIEGPVEQVAEAIARGVGGRVKKTTGFLTATVELDGGEVDIAHARTERYETPGALPVVEPATLADDLARRDFTVNAMALALDPESFGELVDPYGGRDDLRDALLRVLHERSFEDDPTRMLRAARFTRRLGLTLEAHTRELLDRAVAEHRLQSVSGARSRNELRRIFGEAPTEGLADLQALGLLEAMGLPRTGPATIDHARLLGVAAEALDIELDQAVATAACLGLYAAGAGVDARWLAQRLMMDSGERRRVVQAASLVAEPPEVL